MSTPLEEGTTNTILYLDNHYCQSLNDLKQAIEKIDGNTSSSLFKEVRSAFYNKQIEAWLNEGNEEEKSLAATIGNISPLLADNEILERLNEVLIKRIVKVEKPPFSKFAKIKSCNYYDGKTEGFVMNGGAIFTNENTLDITVVVEISEPANYDYELICDFRGTHPEKQRKTISLKSKEAKTCFVLHLSSSDGDVPIKIFANGEERTPLFEISIGNKVSTNNRRNSTSSNKQGAQNGNYNGYEWVDLGLPSGLKWATCNVGANKPGDYGFYFAWGESAPKRTYIRSNSQTYGKDYPWLYRNDYIDGESDLTLTHDAAHACFGGAWRLPTKDDIRELIKHTKTKWRFKDGNYGRLLTSKANGNSIFLPAAGLYDGTSLSENGDYGYYWCASPDENESDAYILSFDSDKGIHEERLERYVGLSVRPVSE